MRQRLQDRVVDPDKGVLAGKITQEDDGYAVYFKGQKWIVDISTCVSCEKKVATHKDRPFVYVGEMKEGVFVIEKMHPLHRKGRR